MMNYPKQILDPFLRYNLRTVVKESMDSVGGYDLRQSTPSHPRMRSHRMVLMKLFLLRSIPKKTMVNGEWKDDGHRVRSSNWTEDVLTNYRLCKIPKIADVGI